MNIKAVFEQLPILESTNLILKKIEPAHLTEVFAIYSNDKVFEYCGIIPKHNIETVKNMIGHFERDYKKRTRVKWGIFPREDSERLVGIIEAVDFNQKVDMVTIGYFLAESAWGKGIATEAVNTLVRFLFESVEVNRIQAEVMPGNQVSKKVLLKNGFLHEGTLRQAALWPGKGVVDLEIYGILKEEYRATYNSSAHESSAHCPECGAPLVEGLNCWEQLGAIIAWEWQDPELLAQHFLTVASYNLQHPAQFMEEAIAGLRSVYVDYLDKGLTIAEIRKRVSTATDGAYRVLKEPAERQPVQRSWAMTIADVYIPGHPENAADRVKAWAAAIRKEL